MELRRQPFRLLRPPGRGARGPKGPAGGPGKEEAFVGLDLTVVAAQIVNFLVLVVLLNRFLYRPVVRIMAAREERVRRRLEEAEALEMQAKAEIAAYQAQQEELRRERARLLEEAREEARQERARLLEEAARDAQNARERFGEALALERAELEASIKEGLVRQVCEAAGYVLGELAGTSLEDAVIATLERRWEGQERERPARPYPPPPEAPPPFSPRAVEVRTSFVPTDGQRARLAALAQRIARHTSAPGASTPPPGAGPEVRFRVDPGLLLGVEVQWGGTSVSWSARDVLEDLQRDALASLVPAGEKEGHGPAAGQGAADGVGADARASG